MLGRGRVGGMETGPGTPERLAEAGQTLVLELKLLRYLAARPGEAVAREELLAEVWGYGPGLNTRTLDTTVRRLRLAIERDARVPSHIQTVRTRPTRCSAAPTPPSAAATATQSPVSTPPRSAATATRSPATTPPPPAPGTPPAASTPGSSAGSPTPRASTRPPRSVARATAPSARRRRPWAARATGQTA